MFPKPLHILSHTWNNLLPSHRKCETARNKMSCKWGKGQRGQEVQQVLCTSLKTAKLIKASQKRIKLKQEPFLVYFRPHVTLPASKETTETLRKWATGFPCFLYLYYYSSVLHLLKTLLESTFTPAEGGFVSSTLVKQPTEKIAMEASLTMQLMPAGRYQPMPMHRPTHSNTGKLIINNSEHGPLLNVCAASPAEILHEPQPELQPSPTSQRAHNTGCYSNQSWVCVTEGY